MKRLLTLVAMLTWLFFGLSFISGWTPVDVAHGGVWLSLGSGMNGDVNALAWDDQNKLLYAGGEFTTAGGVDAKYIARWDGQSWSALGSGMNTSVVALAWDDQNQLLYAAGTFQEAGEVRALGIAKWNGISWSPLGDEGSGLMRYFWPSYYPGWGLSLGLVGSNLYVGGDFTMAGATKANYVAKWNETTGWSALGTGDPGSHYGPGVNNRVYSFAGDGAGSVYVGGTFNSVWDGANWSTLGSPCIARWNEAAYSWFNVGSGVTPNEAVLVLHAEGSNLYAGGSFYSAGGSNAGYIAKWDGGAWSALGSGLSYSVLAIASRGEGNLFAGGEFQHAGDVSVNHIAKWDGLAWSALGTGMGPMASPEFPHTPDVRALVFDGSGNLYAGGRFLTADGVTVNRVARFDTAGPAIGAITFNVATGEFTFAIPDGYAISQVQGANMALTPGGDFNWVDLTLDEDYRVEAGVVTILTNWTAPNSLFRVWLNSTP